MEIIPFAQLSTPHLNEVHRLFFNSQSAYGLLSSTHGYSLTELTQESMNTPDYKQEMALVTEDEILGCVRFDQKDWINRSLRVAISLKPKVSIESLISPTQSLLNSFIQYEGIDRFYIYILSTENGLKTMLSTLEFQQEAILEEHVYIRGKYEDLEIWGTERIRS